MKFCMGTLAFLHPITSYSIYLILPYYVLATPEKKWDKYDGFEPLALFFSAISIGEIVGSQVVPLAALLDSDAALFCGHAIQIIATLSAYFLMSSLVLFDVLVFAAGMFLLGFGYGMSSVQVYCTEIADGDEEEEVELMAMVGQLYIVSNLVYALALPAIYDLAGYLCYCIVQMAITVVMFVAFVVLMLCLCSKQREYKPSFHSYGTDASEDEEDQQQTLQNAAAAQMKSKELDGTHIPLLSILSPSMYALLLIKMAQCLSCQVYYIAYPVVFAQHYHISAQKGGLLHGAASLLGAFGLYANAQVASALANWQYPFDVAVYFMLLAVSCLFYVVVYEAWIGYSLHLIAMSTIMIITGIEMTTRLFLCPSRAFQGITGVVGLLQAGTYLLGSIVTPYMLNISNKFPFLFLAILATAVSIISIAIFAVRNRFLRQTRISIANADGSAAVRVSYLSMERAQYSRIKKSSHRRGAMRSDQITMLDDIQSELHFLQTQFSSRRGLSFLMNPMSSRRLEQFANHAAVLDAPRRPQRKSIGANGKDFNPNALIQSDELAEMKEAIVEAIEESELTDDDVMLARPSTLRNRKVDSESAENVSNERVARASRVQQSRVSMRKSVQRIADKGLRKRSQCKVRGRMSMARQSVFRSCEPAITLNGRGKKSRKEAEREAVRRATIVAKAFETPMSLFRL